jgi:hypothetical protein
VSGWWSLRLTEVLAQSLSSEDASSTLPPTDIRGGSGDEATHGTGSRKILIEQPDEVSPEYSGSIELQPEQIDMLCDWLRQARDEAIALRATKQASPTR